MKILSQQCSYVIVTGLICVLCSCVSKDRQTFNCAEEPIIAHGSMFYSVVLHLSKPNGDTLSSSEVFLEYCSLDLGRNAGTRTLGMTNESGRLPLVLSLPCNVAITGDEEVVTYIDTAEFVVSAQEQGSVRVIVDPERDGLVDVPVEEVTPIEEYFLAARGEIFVAVNEIDSLSSSEEQVLSQYANSVELRLSQERDRKGPRHHDRE